MPVKEDVPSTSEDVPNTVENIDSQKNAENTSEILTEEDGLENIDDALDHAQDIIDKIEDNQIRDGLRYSYKIIGKNCSLISKKLASSEQKKLELEAQMEMARYSWQIEKSKSKASILSQYLQKDLVATTVGAILLFILVIAYSAAMFKGITSPDILNNAFLLILGYFFGQAASKSQKDG